MNEICIKTRVRLSDEDALSLLNYFDDSSDIPLHEGLDFDSYSKKISEHAYFILYYKDKSLLGFIAYYLNYEGKYVYVPQIVVHKNGRHLGVGHQMMVSLINDVSQEYNSLQLEVLKDNNNAIQFYEREAFNKIEDHGVKWLMNKKLK